MSEYGDQYGDTYNAAAPLGPITRGPRQVRDQVVAFLQSRLPSALQQARTAWGLEATDLPEPQRYEPYEPVALDLLPIVATSVTLARNYLRTGVTVTGGQEYQTRYLTSVFAWLKDDGYSATQAGRDDYASVLTGVLLATPSMRAVADDGTTVPYAAGEESYRLEEDTLETSFSDAAKVKGDRWLSGVRLSFQITHTEVVRADQLARVLFTSVQGRVLP